MSTTKSTVQSDVQSAVLASSAVTPAVTPTCRLAGNDEELAALVRRVVHASRERVLGERPRISLSEILKLQCNL